MPSFKKYYRTIYDTFGYPLGECMGMSSTVLDAAQKHLGVHIPPALRDYYLVAGRERRFNTCHNRLLPAKWSIDKQRLIFMEENQAVVWWGVSTRNRESDDPPVSQGVNDEPISWFPEHRRCSEFLALMLHYQAVNGGFRFCRTASPGDGTVQRLQNGWTYYGEVNRLKAYSRSNQAVCLMPLGDAFMNAISVLPGAKTKNDLQAIGDDLQVTIV
jgi:hypothetical protein